MEIFFLFQVASGRSAGFLSVNVLQVSRTAKAQQWVAPVHSLTEQENGIAFVLEPLSGDMLGLFDEADHRHGRRWIDWAAWVLIVETDVAAGNGGVEGA